jgi:hypothetical protein
MNINSIKPILRKSVLIKNTMPTTMYHTTTNINFNKTKFTNKKEKIKTQKRNYLKTNISKSVIFLLLLG